MNPLLAPLCLVALALPLAAAAQPSTYAGTTPGITDIGGPNAFASNDLPEGFLEGEARSFGTGFLGSRSAVTLGAPFSGQHNAYSHAEYTQEYIVTAAGPATFEWYVRGSLNASQTDATAVYQVNYSFNVEADAYFFDPIAAVGGVLTVAGDVPVDRSGSATHEFSAFQVGQTFRVTARLNTVVSSSNFVVTGGNPSVSIESDFFDTAGISGVSGGIAPVPEPESGTLLLFGSILLGILRGRARPALRAPSDAILR